MQISLSCPCALSPPSLPLFSPSIAKRFTLISCAVAPDGARSAALLACSPSSFRFRRVLKHSGCLHSRTWTYTRIHTHIHLSVYAYERPFARCASPWCPLLPPLPYPHCAPDASWSRARRSADRDVNDRELRQGMGACDSTNGPPKIITIRLSENALATNRFEIDTIDKLCFKISWERSMLKFVQEITKINYHRNKKNYILFTE